MVIDEEAKTIRAVEEIEEALTWVERAERAGTQAPHMRELLEAQFKAAQERAGKLVLARKQTVMG